MARGLASRPEGGPRTPRTITAGLDGSPESLAVIAGQPAAVLSAVEEAGLPVLGSRGSGTVTGFLIGSVALAVLARTERPVVLVRAGERAEDEHLPDGAGTPSVATSYREAVLGLNLVNPSDTVIEFAFDAARLCCASCTAGVCRPPMVTGMPRTPYSTPPRPGRYDVDRPTYWSCGRTSSPTSRCARRAWSAGAGAHLLDASREAALIVGGRLIRRAPVGSHIGPVAHAVLHHASGPVAVIPHD
ncbi:universal stress protein [Streptomyces europaeiscabiei]|uniref:universal stress protein n=1 Tax=Streptomyces europaeiscabiei TaxID=146819 RepID=UPI0029BB05EA|nr:universal stress protein [Streptomyces europaeiscabiei]MDX3696751.1 universal stress protein [Streptomyces europaeiscabiei]